MSQTVVEKTVDYISESAHEAARKTSAMADAIEDGASVVKRAAKQGSDAAEEFIDDTTRLIQRNVLATMGATLMVGLVSGAMIGWMMKRR